MFKLYINQELYQFCQCLSIIRVVSSLCCSISKHSVLNSSLPDDVVDDSLFPTRFNFHFINLLCIKYRDSKVDTVFKRPRMPPPVWRPFNLDCHIHHSSEGFCDCPYHRKPCACFARSHGFACSYSSSPNARKPLCLSVKCETMIPALLTFELVAMATSVKLNYSPLKITSSSTLVH